MYIVQLYKEDWTILCMLGCWTIALPSTKQIVFSVTDPMLLTMGLPGLLGLCILGRRQKDGIFGFLVCSFSLVVLSMISILHA